MEHKHVDQLQKIADVQPALDRKPMTRRERLERWADVLEREPHRILRSLREIEYRSRAERMSLRADNSPLTVAASDAVLRRDGLMGDTLGDATAYFGLSEQEAHHLLCSCHYGATLTAGRVARAVRTIAGERTHASVLPWAIAAAALGTPALLYLLG